MARKYSHLALDPNVTLLALDSESGYILNGAIRELAKRVAQGDYSPLLSQKQLQEANPRGGLNLVVWHACIRMEDIKRAEVWTELMAAFLVEHRGFLLKELVAQGGEPR